MTAFFNAINYGSAFGPLLEQSPQNPLGPGNPVSAIQNTLDSISLEAAFAPRKIVDRDMARGCLAGLWLRFDFLDESHTITQASHNATGSFWHGIMHRREPDYDNAKYWFRRVGDHPVFEPLCTAAKKLAEEFPKGHSADFLTRQQEWDPLKFVDLVADVARGQSASEELCRRIQLREWELLFDYCYRAASGKVLDE